jgi:hypothetical protein
MAPMIEDAIKAESEEVKPVLQCGRAQLGISMNQLAQVPASLPRKSPGRGVVAVPLQSNEQQTGRSLRADDRHGS